MFRAVVTDLDGTLLNQHHRVSEYTLETISLLMKKGIPVIVATGRPHPDVLHTLKSCGLQGMYVITSNGARIIDPQLNPIASLDLSTELVSDLIQLKYSTDNPVDCAGSDFSVNLYRHDEWVTDVGKEVLLDMFASSGFRYKVVDNLPAYPKDGVHELFYMADSSTLLKLENAVKTRFAGKVECMMSTPLTLDVVHADANKAKAMMTVAKLLNIELKNIVAFGDGMNDVKMLASAGRGYVMGNAQQRLKEALPDLEVIGSNAEDGVAKKLRELFGLQ
ncbi:putative haloacid dehalogenase like hydrolase Sucrose 6F phosphate phosphohydrolase [Trypanosoma vivax]|uniref:Putative haloacid dehalogenase-like hydrolase n=1 Tax=Trypanosoma vivax (strain Y486) TaxID=1055687 RepID=G0UC89_TRYVY|nr:putative haloacid dehalogenase-like hydrolase [Trypanosoma vivax]KAH8609514.1 putative haloacid dehalogenase like hydrolase Sucrose 6F phosphate phosphohydrolase [Trypanosoma vivax]CCC53439.1 putative haloacid dehalogenase-like hydrolase [Trypanosoma vivax Y486]